MKQKRSRVGCLFWVALILLVIVVFLFNRPKIDRALNATGLTTLVTKQPTAPTVTRVPQGVTETAPSASNGGGNGNISRTPKPTKSTPPVSTRQHHSGQSSQTTAPQSGAKSAAPAHGSSPKTPAKVIHQQFELYFVKVTPNGQTELAPVSTVVDFIDAPLTKTFHSLLSGVTPADERSGIRSLIPEGTKLLQASVKDGTAYLDFNNHFRFNAYGLEGYKAQLEQVVYTATQFPTVQRVQILLDGKVLRFLSPEGIAVDKPLNRSSFGH